jgi:plasmid stabilization system protein ParE
VIPIRWTNGAADQLEAIVKRIREDNAEAARTVVQTVLDRIGILETFPSLGRPGEVEILVS